MKKYLFLTLFLLFNLDAVAQNLTFEEAKKTAQQLYEIELLSKKGEKYLLQEIEKNPRKFRKSKIIYSKMVIFIINY